MGEEEEEEGGEDPLDEDNEGQDDDSDDDIVCIDWIFLWMIYLIYFWYGSFSYLHKYRVDF